MKTNKNQQTSKVKAFFQKLYWLPPLLLVAVVFVLVFSLQGVQGASDTIKGWFNQYSKPRACDLVRVNKVEDVIMNNVVEDGEEVVYIYYYVKNNDVCTEANKGLKIEIKAYNKDSNADNDIKVYAVNYEYEINDIDGKDYEDKKMTDAIFEEISADVYNFYKENDPDVVSGKLVQDYEIAVPTLVRYTRNADGTYSVDNVLTATKATVKENYGAKNLAKFFDGEYNK